MRQKAPIGMRRTEKCSSESSRTEAPRGRRGRGYASNAGMKTGKRVGLKLSLTLAIALLGFVDNSFCF